jgi:hypothetical protein
VTLESAWPNPSNRGWHATISLEDDGPVSVEILDLAGRRLLARTLTGLPAGRHSVFMERPTGLRAGVYLLRVSQSGRSSTRKLALVP